ncbi:MAG: SpoIIE family protein phosphatase [Actinomycetota bacterium]|nr:SpoIIE family protein phosphatase [Actinomycetota bacterium]
MKARGGKFGAAYALAFDNYLLGRDEESLHAAYELGRKAVTAQLSMLDLATIHHGVLVAALQRTEQARTERVTEAASDFFLQSLSAFEMVQRGFREAHETVLLEKAHAAQLHQLADVAVTINSRLSFDDMLQLVTEQARQIIGARCCIASVVLNDGPTINKWKISCSQTRSEWHKLVHGEELSNLYAEVTGAGHPVMMTREELDEDPTWSAFVRAGTVGQAVNGSLVTPLTDRHNDRLGSILVMDKCLGEFSEKDESILVQLAQMASVAIENGRLYQREHRIAETLQRGLSLQALPWIPDMTIAVRYLPGAAGVNVGGDWFDVVALPGGRTGIAVGDVIGRGVRAASVMGQTRTAFRAYALDGNRPETVVARLNRLLPTLDGDHFSTMVYLVWDPADGMSMVSAGHPPPLLREATGRVSYLDHRVSTPLGVLEDAGYKCHKFALETGSTLLLYTDGLIEQQGGLEDGLTRLRNAVAIETDDVETLCDQVLEHMLDAEAKDDVALLILRLD